MFRLESPYSSAPPSHAPGEKRGAADPSAEAPRAGKPIEIARVTLALRRAQWLLVGAGVAGAALGVGLGKTVAPVEYASHATLLWEPNDAEQADRSRAEKTLVDSIELPSMLASIRERLDLPMTVDQVGARIEVTTTSQSNVLVLVAKSDDPKSAQHIGGAAIESLLEARQRLYRARAADDLALLDGDLSRARDATQAARADLVSFRREHHLVDVSSETEHAIHEAARLRSEANSADAEAAAEAARATTLRGKALSESERTVVSERIVRPGAVKLAELQVEKAKLGAELSEAHPNVLALGSAEEALAGEASASGTSAEQTIGRNPQWDAVQQNLAKAEADESALRTRHDAYANLAEAAEKRVGELGEVEGRAASLLATVKAAEKRLGELEVERAAMKDASESPRSGLRVLADADLPTAPSKSLRKIIAIATPIGALVVALLAILVRALWGLRVHTANELAYHAGLPVVATSAWPNDPTQLQELAVDLTDAWPSTASTPLVRPPTVALVALASGDTTLAEKLVRCMDRRISRRDALPSLSETIATSVYALEKNHPETRRLARRVDKLLILVRAGEHSALGVRGLREIVGRSDRIGLVLVGARAELMALPDRAGEADAFWRAACSA
jgi:uncharacterized protein involved in exopolysaccharide biosynthesis